MALATPMQLFAETAQKTGPVPVSQEQIDQLRNDMQLAYWGKLDHDMPFMTEFALGEPITDGDLWHVSENNPLVDQDPFFMRSQAWEQTTSGCQSGVCFSKDRSGVTLAIAGSNQSLRLNASLTPILETSGYVLLTADDKSIFQQKNPRDGNNPGEGLFFISKGDLQHASQKHYPVPVFFFPTPGEGWTGDRQALEMGVSDQILVYDQSGFGLPIDRADIQLLERTQRNNLSIAEAWSFLEGNVRADGVAFPQAGSTLMFGTILSGKMPNSVFKEAAARGINIENIASRVGELVLPQANAKETEPTWLDRIRAAIKGRSVQEEALAKNVQRLEEQGTWKGYLKRWVAPLVLYGGTGALAVSLAPTIDWSNLITDDMPGRIATVGKMLGVVAVASVAMKYSIYREKFAKKYPRVEGESWLSRLNKEHKGILDVLTHGLYFSIAVTPQGIRHVLEFLKDHFMPSNNMVHRAWEWTMGFQMRQNSHLAMNWKTAYLGILVFGMSDSIMVGLDMLIFTPALMHFTGWGAAAGAATAAFVSSEVLRNFLGYIQSGAHSYSADVKFTQMNAAEADAKNIVRARGMDPDAPKNQEVVQELMEEQMERRFKNVGLPSSDEFLYDPISVLEKITERSGFNPGDEEQMTDAQKATLAKHKFVLAKRRWGLIQPALKKALATARQTQEKSPSATGAQTIQLLEWALNDRSQLKSGVGTVAGRAWDAWASQWGRDALKEASQAEIRNYQSTTNHPSWFGVAKAGTVGALKYLAKDSTAHVRDIRQVLYLMSSTGNARELAPFLPNSWRAKAGSEQVALLGAELFHRAFFSYYEGDPTVIQPDAALISGYEARARQVVSRMARTDADLNDAFTFEVRVNQVMHRLRQKDKERSAIVNYSPKALSAYGQRQWNTARQEALKVMDLRGDQDVAPEWETLAQKYQEGLGVDVDRQTWIKDYQFRLVVAQAFAKTVGLQIEGVDSEYVGKVIEKAAAATEKELVAPEQKMYLDRLDAADREFYQAQIFTRHFIDSYVDMSINSHDYLKASSPEYPGRFQKVRRAMVGVPGGSMVSGVVRFFEAMFRNDQGSYAPGMLSFLSRNVPFAPDLFHNAVRTVRSLPYTLSISYLTSYYIWQIKYPYAIWAFFMVISFLNPAMVEFNNRIQKNYGRKPMDDVPSKLTYSWVHSRLTNPEIMALQMYSESVAGAFEKYVETPLYSAAGACERFLVRGPGGK